MNPVPPPPRRPSNLLEVPQKKWIPRTASEDADSLDPFAPITFTYIHPTTRRMSSGVPLMYVSEGAPTKVVDVVSNAYDKVFQDAYRAYLRIQVCLAFYLCRKTRR